MVSSIESVTVGVRDLDAAIAEFRDRLRLAVVCDTRASVGLLAAWRRPVHERVRLVELGAPGAALGRLRLAQFESFTGPEAANERSTGPRHVSLRAAEDALVRNVTGDLPVAVATEARATLAVVTRDVAASERFYVQGLGWTRRDATSFAAADSAGIDVALTHSPSAEDTSAERPVLPGQLGINLCTCHCDDLDEVETRLAAIGIEAVTRPTHVGLPVGRPGRVMLVRGPAGELFELVEIAA